jgi:putative ABC transport system permease protein
MRWLSRFFHRSKQDSQLDSEFRFHVDQQIADYIAGGMNPGEARRRALAQFGGLEYIKEETRDARGTHFVESLLQDLRFAFRMLRKSPGFTAIAVLTLALGIGANTAIFSVVDAVILRPLPFKNSSRIVTIDGYNARRAMFKPALHFQWADWAKGTKTLEDISAYEDGEVNLAGGTEAVRVRAAEVSENFFHLLGVQPIRGRTFTGKEESTRPSVAILAAGFWKEHYNANPGMIGKIIELNGKPFTVIGILPEALNFPSRTQIWLPLPMNFDDEMFGGNAFMALQMARLRPGARMRQAQSELEVIEQREDSAMYQYQRSHGANPIEISSLHTQLVGNARFPMLMLFGAAGFVLLIACADVANLLVSRSTGRSREVAIRSALGASRLRLFRQFLCESILLAGLGGGAGLVLALWSLKFARLVIPDYLLSITQTKMDESVLAFTFGASVFVGIVCGLIPALRLSKVELNGAIKEASGGSAGGFSFRSRNRLRGALGISEIALALMLLVGAGLFLRSLNRLLDVNPGFRSDSLLTGHVALMGPQYRLNAARSDFLEQVLSRIKSQPAVRDAAVVNAMPFGNAISVTFGLNIEGKPPFNPDTGHGALFFEISEDYFRTMGIPLLEGRYFTKDDASGATPVAVIDQEMALQCWPNENPLGKRFSFAGGSPRAKPFQVVGVVGDIRNFALGEAPKPAAYFPVRQMSPDDAFLVVQAVRDPAALVSTVRDAVSAVDKNEPISSFATMNQLIWRSVSEPRVRSIVLATFGGLALLLAIIGIYAVMSYAVTERTHEIGVRIALGAQRGDVLRMVIREGMLLAAVGIVTGVGGALALTRFLRSLLFEIKTTDPATFVGVSILLLLVALAACYIPARRAMRVDPMVALRYE